MSDITSVAAAKDPGQNYLYIRPPLAAAAALRFLAIAPLFPANRALPRPARSGLGVDEIILTWVLSSRLAASLLRTYSVRMSSLRFEWDPRKAAANRQKHGVSFEDAQSVFSDERARLIDDPDHSEDEDRFLLLGLSSSLRLLVVAHCYRVEGNVIRIISARKATRDEQDYYP